MGGVGRTQREMTSYRTSVSSCMKKIRLFKLTRIQCHTALSGKEIACYLAPLFAGKNLVKF